MTLNEPQGIDVLLMFLRFSPAFRHGIGQPSDSWKLTLFLAMEAETRTYDKSVVDFLFPSPTASMYTPEEVSEKIPRVMGCPRDRTLFATLKTLENEKKKKENIGELAGWRVPPLAAHGRVLASSLRCQRALISESLGPYFLFTRRLPFSL